MHPEENESLDIIDKINTELNTYQKRDSGLKLLEENFHSLNVSTIEENAVLWLSCCVPFPVKDAQCELKLRIISKLMETCRKTSDFSKRFVNDYIAKVVDLCLQWKRNNYETIVSLRLLKGMMIAYNGWFTQHKIKIENHLIKLMENYSEEVVKAAGQAFLYLQQTGSGGKEGVNHIQDYYTKINSLCSSIHRVFDSFFEDKVTEIDSIKVPEEPPFIFIEVTFEENKSLHIEARRIKNCIIFLIEMIRGKFPVQKKINLLNILNVIQRGIAPHLCTNAMEGDIHFSLLLIQVQTTLLKLLNVLIKGFQEKLLPFHYVITKILMDCLGRINSCICFKSNKNYQKEVFKTWGTWISVANCSFNATFQEQILNNMVKSVLVPVNKNNSHSEIYKVGLATLSILFQRVDLKINQENFNEILAKLFLIIKTSKESSDIREGVFKVLISLHHQKNNFIPVADTLNHLRFGLKDTNPHIVKLCENGLFIIEGLCQPISPLIEPQYIYERISKRKTDDSMEHLEKRAKFS